MTYQSKGHLEELSRIGGGAHVKGVGIPIIFFDFSQKSKERFY